jgi:hypothetical protein
MRQAAREAAAEGQANPDWRRGYGRQFLGLPLNLASKSLDRTQNLSCWVFHRTLLACTVVVLATGIERMMLLLIRNGSFQRKLHIFLIHRHAGGNRKLSCFRWPKGQAPS